MPNQDSIPYPPQPFDFSPNRDAPILNVLKYQADVLLALTLPRVKHGSADIIPSAYEQDFQNDAGTVLARKPLAGNSAFFTVGQTQISGKTSSMTLMSPRAAKARWAVGGQTPNGTGFVYTLDYRPSGQYDGDGRPTLDSLSGVGRGGQDTSPQVDALVDGTISRFKPIGEVGSVGRYRTMAYAELQLAPRASTNLVTHPGTTQTKGVSDVNYDKDFVDLVIGELKFRAYITNFTDSFTAMWSDLQYIGRQDVFKVFKGSTRSVSLSFKTAAFTKLDLNLMYQKLNGLVNNTMVGRIDPTYLRAPFTEITIGKWFVKTPCIVNSIKLDTQPTEYSWDVGDVRDRTGDSNPSPDGLPEEQADPRQLPMIVDVSMDFSILGDASGQTLDGNNTFFSTIAQP